MLTKDDVVFQPPLFRAAALEHNQRFGQLKCSSQAELLLLRKKHTHNAEKCIGEVKVWHFCGVANQVGMSKVEPFVIELWTWSASINLGDNLKL